MARRILVTQRVVENESYKERRDALSQEWSGFIENLFPNAAIIPVPNTLADVRAWADIIGADALVLTGGNDWGTAPERDATETSLVALFSDCGLPIFAVCRGLQALNAIHGGQLTTDLTDVTSVPHIARNHEVSVTGSVFQELAGGPTITVNSFHGQGVLASEVDDRFRPFATAPDEVVEGIYHCSAPVLAIQWHPERESPSSAFDSELMVRLFRDGAFWL